jgi:diguanylate cyclase (GGDEF)-like protein
LRKTTDDLAESERRSLTDQLTGVWNRRYLERALHEEENRGTRFGHAFCVMLLDVDHFKAVNDTFGHEGGDAVLVEVCRRAQEILRGDLDTLARLGGEEFAVVLPETTRHGAFVVAEKIREAIASEPFLRDVHVTVSIGVAAYPYDGETSDELLRVADAALYEAKRSGRDRVVLAESLTAR